MGANVIDADAVAKDQWSRPEIQSAMTGRWGPEVLRDGAPDYAKIAERAFSNDEEYSFTNSLIHPAARAEIARRVSALRGWIVVEIPLFFESGGAQWADWVVYVTAPDEDRVRRNASRGWAGEEIARRERFLMASEKKQKMADRILRNDGDMASWEASALNLGKLLRAISGVCEVTTFCESAGEVDGIASELLRRKLAACVNISEAASRYVWRGEERRHPEWRLSCKTIEANIRTVRDCIRKNHSYELPAITATELCRSDFETLKWIADSCSE
jgi:dephospho-CoA kinase/uncharacterized protein involved in tolerance to divalent cations